MNKHCCPNESDCSLVFLDDSDDVHTCFSLHVFHACRLPGRADQYCRERYKTNLYTRKCCHHTIRMRNVNNRPCCLLCAHAAVLFVAHVHHTLLEWYAHRCMPPQPRVMYDFDVRGCMCMCMCMYCLCVQVQQAEATGEYYSL